MMPHRLKGRNWGSFVEVKINIPKVLASELKRISKGRVLISSITDPYQPIEAEYQLTRKCIELLSKRNLEVVVLTKSTLFLRDLSIMKKETFEIGVTITTLKAHQQLEPNSPSPRDRLKALKETSKEGFKTFLFLGPLISGVVDDELQEILEAAYSSGVQYVIIDKLNIKGDVAQAITKALNENQLKKFRENMANPHWIKRIKNEITRLCKKLRLPHDFCF